MQRGSAEIRRLVVFADSNETLLTHKELKGIIRVVFNQGCGE
ncbi:hypothetical protein EMIT053CA3_130041 [Pseudomonas donghuensis]